MNKTIRIYLFLCLLLVSFGASSQQVPVYSQYFMNKFLLNPAVAGHEGYTSINLTGRQQWVGLADAPAVVALSAQTRLLKNSFISRSRSIRKRRRVMSRSGRVGLGGYVFSSQNGVFNKNGFQGTYSYHISNRKSQFSLGVSLLGMQYLIDKDAINVEDIDDNLLLTTSTKAYVVDGNFGLYYSDKNVYAGLSAQNLFESWFKLNNREGAGFQMERHYIAMAGYRYDVMDFLYLEPSFLYKFSESVSQQIDITLTTYMKEEYWLGLSYRSGGGSSIASESLKGRGSSIIAFGGFKVSKFYLGYSYDYSFNSISKRTWGSHEINLAVKFGDNARRYKWLNRY